LHDQCRRSGHSDVCHAGRGRSRPFPISIGLEKEHHAHTRRAPDPNRKVGHAVHEDPLRPPPMQWLVNPLRPQRHVEPALEMVARDSPPPLGERLRIAVIAPSGHLCAPGDRVPGCPGRPIVGPRPFDLRRRAHAALASSRWEFAAVGTARFPLRTSIVQRSLKKNATPAQRSGPAGHGPSPDRAAGALGRSRPTMTQSMPVRSRLGSGPSSGSRLRKRVVAGAARRASERRT
jgi:hypothetical protein